MTWTLLNSDFRKVKMPVPKDGQRVVLCSDFPYSPRVHKGRRTGSSAGGYSNKSKASHAGSGAVSEIEYDPITKELMRAAVKWVVKLKPEWSIWFADDETAQLWKTLLRKAGQYVFATVPWVKTDAPARKSGEGPDSDTEWLVAADGVGLPPSSVLRRIAQEIDEGDVPENDRIIIARHMKRIRRYENRDGYYIEPTASTRGKPGKAKMQGKKPLGLMRKVLRHYAEPGDLIIDLTCGEGTTGVAAIEYGCDFFGCEIRESTFKVARQNLTAADAQIVMPMLASTPRARQVDVVKTAKWDVKRAAEAT